MGATDTGGKETGGKVMGVREMGGKETGWKAMGVREIGGKVTGARETGGKAKGKKALGGQDSQEMGGKGDMLMGEREMDNMLPGDTTVGQNVTEGIRCKTNSEVVIEGVRRKARVFVGDSIVRKTDRALKKGDDVVICFPGEK